MTDAQLVTLYHMAADLSDYLYRECGVRDLMQRQAAADNDGPPEVTDGSQWPLRDWAEAVKADQHEQPDDLSDSRYDEAPKGQLYAYEKVNGTWVRRPDMDMTE